MYLIVKNIHMFIAIISILGFVVRGGLKFGNSPILEKKLIKILPHIIDTILLLSALVLVTMFISNVGMQGWIVAKVLGLIVYIFLGLGVMRFAESNGVRALYFIGAILTFAYVFSVAITKSAFLS